MDLTEHFIDQHTVMHQYLICTINTHIETSVLQYINASQYCPISIDYKLIN